MAASPSLPSSASSRERPVVHGIEDVGDGVAFEFTVSGALSVADLTNALKVAGGLSTAKSSLFSRLDVVDPTGHRIDLRDAVRIARKVAGLESNP